MTIDYSKDNRNTNNNNSVEYMHIYDICLNDSIINKLIIMLIISQPETWS